MAEALGHACSSAKLVELNSASNSWSWMMMRNLLSIGGRAVVLDGEAAIYFRQVSYNLYHLPAQRPVALSSAFLHFLCNSLQG